MTWQPEREIEIIAGTPPGGGLDRSARALARALEAGRLLEVPVKVENVGGDSSRRAWARLGERPADPHVLSISSSNLATDHLLGAVRYRHETDFTPLAILYTEYIAFVARSDSSIRSAGDLLERFGNAAGAVTVALSTALGNPNHIALAKAVRHAGGDVNAPVVRVFGSALDAVADVVAGKSDVAAVTAASPLPELESGTMRALAVSAPQRLAGLYGSTPTWCELAVDCVIGAWRGVTGARGLAPAQASFWETTLAAAIATAEWQSELARHYWTGAYLDGQALRDHLKGEYEEMRAELRDLQLLKA
ncbi:MAG TPA: tripartite tricarboxylate transporter substrate-binding protein [Burkholderiales bacterium]|nr:tripartite tricarboxylate transporter substrate-binding protein [Burkholderiales bacterium]